MKDYIEFKHLNKKEDPCNPFCALEIAIGVKKV